MPHSDDRSFGRRVVRHSCYVVRHPRNLVASAILAPLAFGPFVACSAGVRSNGPLSLGDEATESCVSNPPKHKVFFGQVAKNDSRADVQITRVLPEESNGIATSGEYIVPIVNRVALGVERLPSAAPIWSKRIPIEGSPKTSDEAINIGFIAERTGKEEGRVARLVVEYTADGVEYTTKGMMGFRIADSCEF